MENHKVRLYILTYGMIGISFILMILERFLEINFYDLMNTKTQNIVEDVLWIAAISLIMVCAINILRFREVPRPRTTSITGTGAVFTGIILLIPLVIIEASFIIDLVKNLF